MRPESFEELHRQMPSEPGPARLAVFSCLPTAAQDRLWDALAADIARSRRGVVAEHG